MYFSEYKYSPLFVCFVLPPTMNTSTNSMILSRNFRSRLAFVLNNNDHPVKLRSLTPGRGALWVIRRDAEALIMVCIVVWSCIQGGYRWPWVRVSWPPSYTSPVATPYPVVIHRGSTPPDECTRIIQYQVGDEEIAAFVTSWRESRVRTHVVTKQRPYGMTRKVSTSGAMGGQ